MRSDFIATQNVPAIKCVCQAAMPINNFVCRIEYSENQVQNHGFSIFQAKKISYETASMWYYLRNYNIILMQHFFQKCTCFESRNVLVL